MATLNHVSLIVIDVKASVRYYLARGMKVYWQPDDDNVYLTNGNDVLALHKGRRNHFDHLGFCLESKEEVDKAYTKALLAHEPLSQLQTHRDGSYGFYTKDPAGFSVEIIYIPRRE
jgi:predicted lactoylglutathione lyase